MTAGPWTRRRHGVRSPWALPPRTSHPHADPPRRRSRDLQTRGPATIAGLALTQDAGGTVNESTDRLAKSGDHAQSLALKDTLKEVGKSTSAASKQSVQSVPGGEPAGGATKKPNIVRPIEPGSGMRTRHTITRFLAEGGLGKVFVAQDVDLSREVVLKTLKSQTARGVEAKKRFLKEAQVNAQLEHPNIIPIYQAGKDSGDGQPYYTMKFIRGKEFADLIGAYHQAKAEGNDDPMEFRRLIGLFINTCNAIGYAHHRGVVHRDLKPANIAVGEFGELIVLDWGLAKVLSETEETETDTDPRLVSVNQDADTGVTVKGRIMGTPGYMAPEQAGGLNDTIGPPADIYALGAILFEILTNEAPHKPIHKYDGDKLSRWSKRDVSRVSILSQNQSTTGTQLKENTMDMLGRIIGGAIPAPRDIAPKASPALAAICEKAMKLAVAERYKSAGEIAADAQRWLADEPVSVYTDSWQEKLGRWMRKNRQKVQTGVAALAAIVVVAIFAAVLINGARHSARLHPQPVR